MTVQSIPAADLVNVTPGVLGAGGTGQTLTGLCLSNSSRAPIGPALSFPSAEAVGAYFGLSSPEYAWASVYFLGFNNGILTPASALFAQYNTTAVPAYLRGASMAGVSLAALQGYSGTLTLTIDGNAVTSSSIDLSGATSFSNAASLIQTALGLNDASFTAAIAPGTSSVTAAIAGTTMTVSAQSAGSLFPGQVISGTGVTVGTTIVAQLTGTAGGTGTYQVSVSQTVASTTIAATSSNGLMTVSALASGALAIGQTVLGSTTLANTTITQFLTGVGGTGIYVVSLTQTVSSAALTSGAAVVTFDSVSSAFVITGGTPGVGGTITFATGTNNLATNLKLASTSGAVLSQGAAPQTPVAFMANLVTISPSFATFSTLWEPVTSDGLAFAQWTNSTGNKYLFVGWDTDPNALLAGQTTTLAAEVLAATYSGTFLLWEPSNLYQDAFVLGLFASINFTATNGRVNPTYKSQSGITPGVFSQTNAAQLRANGYNFYGQWATATQQFQGLSPGSITGPFLWADAYVNQIVLNSGLQGACMFLLFNTNFIPYNAQGRGEIKNACLDPILQAVTNGTIQPGVNLSQVQITELIAAAGLDISGVLYAQGWYFQVLPASATVRAARGSPPINFWYTDGGSVQNIALFSEDVQ
jgi:hypothetical protein